jgi:dolichol kinase
LISAINSWTGFTVSFGGTTAVLAALFLFVFVFFFAVDLFVFFLAAGAWACAVPNAMAMTTARRDNLINRFFIF